MFIFNPKLGLDEEELCAQMAAWGRQFRVGDFYDYKTDQITGKSLILCKILCVEYGKTILTSYSYLFHQPISMWQQNDLSVSKCVCSCHHGYAH